MTLFSRYIFRQAANALLMILLSLTAVVWIAMALKQLSVITSGGAGAGVFFEITALILPGILAMIAPFAMLIAALYTLNKLNQDSELIVMTAAGSTLWRFARPLLGLALIVSTWLMVVNFFLGPWSEQALNELFNTIKTDLVAEVLQPGTFASPEDGLTFHIRERTNDGHLLGLMMSDTRAETEQFTYVANSGDVVKQGAKSYLVLRDGKVIRRARSQQTSIIEFESYVLDLATAGQKSSDPESLKPHSRYINDLISPDPNDPRFKDNPRAFAAELHERIVNLIYPFVFVVIVVAFVGQARTNRQNRSQSQVAAFGAAVGLRVAGIAATNLVNTNIWAIALVYALPLGGLLAATAHAWASTIPRPARRRGRTGGLMSGLGARLSSLPSLPGAAGKGAR